MELTTLCYIEKDDQYLMLHRIKKQEDINQGKWIGIGGHFEFAESPEDCLLREAREETGLILEAYQFRGIVTFVFNDHDAEYMCLYTATKWSGELIDCNEGVLQWIPKTELGSLNLWEGDRIFLKLLMEREQFFSLKLTYQDDTLLSVVLDGEDYPIEQGI